jgi:hypothetical protein
VLTPPGSKIISVRQGVQDVGLEEVDTENGLSVFGRFFTLPRDTKQRLSFTYKTPPVVDKVGDTWTYTLNVQREPGWELPMTLRVGAPAGMHRDQTLVDGQPVAWSANTPMKVDLSQDRVITMRFRSDG